MNSRLHDWGYSVSTGPLVWNRFKKQLREKEGGDKAVHPLIWAEAVTADGKFIFRAKKKNHVPFFKLERGDDWLLVKDACVLVQRTTAKEQARRLIAAELPIAFVQQHNGVVIENHLNMIRSRENPRVPAAVVAAILNSVVLDQVFRCMNGSVAVSAFELEALPLPDAAELEILKQLIRQGADRDSLEAECVRLYGERP
jgi:adenine-specific DNA-methyltransferase